MSTVSQFSSTPSHESHFVRFYDDPGFLLREATEFVVGACRSGGTGVVFATLDHVHVIRAGALEALGAEDLGERLITVDAHEALDRFMFEGWPDEERFVNTVGAAVAAAAARGGPVHAFGEMVSLLCAEGRYEAAIRLEELWNALGERHRFSLFCGYDSRLFASADQSAAFQEVCRLHSHVCRSEQLSVAKDPLDVQRLVASWQQKALALDNEVLRRERVEQTLQRRETDFEDFAENAVEGLHRVDGTGTIVWCNRAELAMLGYARDEYVGHHVSEFHIDEAVAHDMLRRLAAGETLYDQPARLRCKDGSVKHVLIHSNGCFENGELVYTRCFTRDGTDRIARQAAEEERNALLQRASAEREKLLTELEAASRAKDEFLAMLGHELRNPLSPIVTALQLMRMRGTTGTEREQRIIQRQVDHLVRLVDDLLDISKVTRGKIELKRERVDVADVVAKAIEMASPLLEQRSHRLTVDARPGLQWEGDAVRLAQVITNLLTNAARYTGVGGDITVTARRAADAGIAISVADNGAGIAADVLPHIFELFFQGKRSVERSEGGLGIGLALVKSLVEMHGGSVSAASAGLGRGSQFSIHLPVPTDVAPRQAPDPLLAAAAPGAAQRRVLLVDDNVDAAQTLGLLLQASGHNVTVLHDPVSALQLMDRFTPDIAVLDIGLPVMNGYELAAHLRTRLVGRPCRLIALTGYGQDSDRSRSQEAGFDLHLVKPVDSDALLEAVNRPLAHQRSNGAEDPLPLP